VNRPPPLNECLTVEQMVEQLPISKGTFENKYLPEIKSMYGCHRFGRTVYIHRAHFEAYLRKFWIPPNPAAALNLPR